MKMKPETQKHFDNILDTMTGADGGIRFVQLKVMLEDLDNREDDEAAGHLVRMMTNFSRLINIANREAANGGT